MISDFDIVEEKIVTLAEVRDILDGIEEKNLEQKKAFKHARSFAKLKKDKAVELREQLEALDLRKLKKIHVAKIIDVLPQDLDDLKLILEDSKTAFTNEELQQVLDVVTNFK